MNKNRCERKYNIDLLRVVSMIGVIILHYNGWIGHACEYTNTIPNRIISATAVGGCLSAVNIFMIMSGYFMIDKNEISFAKPLLLLIQNAIIRLGLYIYSIIFLEGSFSLYSLFVEITGTSYFIILYLCTYILSPFINLLLHNMNMHGRKVFVFTCVGVFSIYPFILDIVQYIFKRDFSSWSSVGAFGSQNGYTITVFVLMYIIGAAIKLEERKIQHPFIGYIICAAVLTLMRYMTVYFNFQISLMSYYNPFVVFEAICVFHIFEQLSNEKIRGGTIINSLAEATLTILLVHSNYLVNLDIEKYASGNVLLFILHMFFGCTVIYLLSFPIHCIYANTIEKMLKRVFKHIPFPVISNGVAYGRDGVGT